MPRPAGRTSGGAAAESVSFRINEGPRPAPELPFRLTYMGDGVVEVPGVGRFAKHVSAGVSAEVAARFRGQAGWVVEP